MNAETSGVIVANGFTSNAFRGRVVSAVDKLTPEEMKQLEEAKAAIDKADSDLSKLQQAIAAKHGMKAEHWMEWSTDVEFSGGFILKWYTGF
jgi:hypothetical protein